MALVGSGLALSLLLGLLPRVMDHHWAERLPGHGHLVGDSGQLHRHPYQKTAHGHDLAGFPDGEGPDPGRVVVSFHDYGVSSALAPASRLLGEESTPATPPLGRFSSAPGEDARPAGIAPGVPHPPPISTLLPPAG